MPRTDAPHAPRPSRIRHRRRRPRLAVVPAPEPVRPPRDDDLIDQAEVLAMLGKPSRMTLWRLIKAERFPPALNLGAHTRRWRRGVAAEAIRQLERASQPRQGGK